MNIDALLEPISTESPCGENLEYDDEFMSLEYSLLGKVEQQFGDITIPAEPPDWKQAEKQAISLLSRTKDLRIIMALTQSWLETRGLSGYADGLNLIQKTLERYWEEVWPKLEFEGEYDPLFRLNILAAIEDNSPLSLQMQHSILLKNISKDLSFLEACSLLDGTISEISGYIGGRSRLLDELKQQINSSEILAVISIRDHLVAIFDIIRQKLSESHAPKLSQLLKQLNKVIEFFPTRQETKNNSQESFPKNILASAPTDTEQKDLASMETLSTNRMSIHLHEIEASNRDEARMLLEKAKNYFLTHEPSHPAPIMIARIQRLIDRDFIDIVYDLAPDGLSQLEIIFGRSDNLDSN
ncbi:type VI secretion system protein TssA [Xenorhabdus anantnagensis]|uniref:Type VI secretion system protein TssA n=1 Tax=Xenorhabdus anantnagensis TaxID=3025875 RepID=A0ABT5LLZ3_9GAMM|nr:type VI secretion system protein TssA [Xenorhabdus anantnagensis]MDC9595427.1 type VI secretion system protein TssA [Xenorhabdus anantnagensis]